MTGQPASSYDAHWPPWGRPSIQDLPFGGQCTPTVGVLLSWQPLTMDRPQVLVASQQGQLQASGNCHPPSPPFSFQPPATVHPASVGSTGNPFPAGCVLDACSRGPVAGGLREQVPDAGLTAGAAVMRASPISAAVAALQGQDGPAVPGGSHSRVRMAGPG